MDQSLKTTVDSQQLMELYLNSLFVNAATIEQEDDIETSVATKPPEIVSVAPAPLSVMFFQVGRFKIATSTAGIYRVVALDQWRHCIRRLANQQLASHGLLNIYNKNFEIIDISAMLAADDDLDHPLMTLDTTKYLILTLDSMHAVMCDDLQSFANIPINNVRQQRKPLHPAWHLGTALTFMVPIIDLSGLISAYKEK